MKRAKYDHEMIGHVFFILLTIPPLINVECCWLLIIKNAVILGIKSRDYEKHMRGEEKERFLGLPHIINCFYSN